MFSDIPESSITRMATPTMIRYQPNHLKPYFARKFTNHFMASSATTNETIQPTASIVRLCAVAQEPSSFSRSSRSSKVAPAIVGTARKNENSAARLRVSPFAMPPTMVAIERLVPGMTDRHWNRPMLKALFSFTLFSSLPLLKILSQKSMNTPPTTSITATTHTESSSQSSSPLFFAAIPMTTAGSTPTKSSQ